MNLIWPWLLAGALIGAIAGSFISTLIIRWPQGRRVNGRSLCDGCEVRLRWFELVPLLSFLLQRGRCRRCGSKIAAEHIRMEISAALVGAAAQLVAPGWQGFAGGCFGWLLLGLMVLDYRYFWLPDRLTGLLAAGGLSAGAFGFAPPFTDRLVGGAAGYATLALIAWSFARLRGRKGMGAGDPKLLGAIGFWLGWQSLPFVLLGASMLAVPLIIIQLVQKGSITAQTRLPLGTLMAAAAYPIWLFSH